MGNCVSGEKHPPNFFFVKNINEDKNLVQRGLLEVSETELIYTDNTSADRWTWPLKYLRKYGCDGEVFSFEAGRKCPGGEGLYAFSSKRASRIFELVAKNINQGEQQVPNGEVSPFPSETRPPDLATMSFMRQQSPPPVVSPPTEAPAEGNYTNIGQDGFPLVQPEPPAAQPPKGQYLPVVFQKPPQEHPVPERNPDNPPTSYTQIDFERTEQMNRERLQGTLLQNPNAHRSSGSVTLPPSQPQKHRHRRLNTVSSGASHNRRSSESSFSSQSSLTESSRNLTSPQVGNGHIAHATIGEEPSGATYQNVLLAQQQVTGAPGPHQPGLYQNVNVGQGSVGEVFNTSETRYANMEYPARHHTMGVTGNGSVTPHKVNGIGTYAHVEIDPKFRSRATSTPVAQDSSYLQLDFQKDQTPNTNSVTGPPDHTSLVPQPSLSSTPRTPDVSAIQPPREERAASIEDLQLPLGPGKGMEVIDECKVTYGTLNFPAMAALSETSRAREQEISENHHDISERLEKESRERKISTSHLKGFKKSHKEK